MTSKVKRGAVKCVASLSECERVCLANEAETKIIILLFDTDAALNEGIKKMHIYDIQWHLSLSIVS